jgi:hypothetical protein
MRNAIRFADSFIGHRVNARIAEALAAAASDAELGSILSGAA